MENQEGSKENENKQEEKKEDNTIKKESNEESKKEENVSNNTNNKESEQLPILSEIIDCSGTSKSFADLCFSTLSFLNLFNDINA